MHHSLIVKYTSHESRKTSQHFIHLSNTRICMKATTNKMKFELSQLLPLEKAWSFQKITDFWDRLGFHVWIRNFWLKSSVEGKNVDSIAVAQALCKEIVYGSIFKLLFCLFF